MNKQLQYLLYLVAIVIVVLFLFHDILSNQFTGFDDLDLITQQWNNIQADSYIKTAFTNNVFQTPAGDYYRPLQLLTYKLDWHLFGTPTPSPFPFFLGNICWLVIGLWATFFTLNRWVLSPLKSFYAVILIALLPATIQSTAWIPGRGELVLMCFSMLYLNLFFIYLKTKTLPQLISLLFSYLLCLFTKETAVVIPVLSIIYWLLHNNTISINRLEKIKLLACLIALTLIWFTLRFYALGFAGNINLAEEIIKLPFRTILTIGQLVFPYPLAVFKGWDMWQFVLSVIAVLLLFATTFRNTKNKALFYFGCAWILLFSIPSGLNSLIMFHRGYVASIGLVMLLSTFAPLNKSTSIKILSAIGFQILLLCHFDFKEAFKTPVNFWQNAFYHNPKSGMAINGLAWTYQQNKEIEKAIPLFQESITLNPQFPQNRINLAYAYAENNRFDSLDYLMLQEFIVTKDSSLTAYHYGGLLLLKGDTVKAIPYLKMGIQTTAYNYNAQQYYDTLSIDFD